MHLSVVAVWCFSRNCACEEAATAVGKVVYVNRQRFGAESNLIAGSRNKKLTASIARRGCALRWATARPAAGIPPHASRADDTTFDEQAKRVVRALSAGSLCRLSKGRTENGQAGRFRRSAWQEGLFAIGLIGRQPGWRDHQARTMNGGSEHLNVRSQWRRVESQIIVTNFR